MCGIVGVARCGSGSPLSEPALVRMRDVLRHRGPDDAGTFRADGIALGSRRLAILDTSPAGRMPMATSDGRYWIAYNGEVYNFRELREVVEQHGQAIHSGTDTEVLLNLYALEGPAFLDRLDGMFALAIWDVAERALFLARDRLGIKPLYYRHSGDGTLTFASEEKALFSAGVHSAFDGDCWEELLCFRHVAGERTPFVDVKRLLPGHFLIWRNGVISGRCWWDLAERTAAARERAHADPYRWFADTFDQSSDERMISDVPVGVLLSGGIDSGSIAASLAVQGHREIASFSVRFDDPRYDEGSLAREVADRWGLEHHEIKVPTNQLMARLEKASWVNDEPLAHASDVHLLAISEYAKPRVSVLLSGEGADETLGGYVRYQPLRYTGMIDAARYLWTFGDGPFLPARVRKLARLWREGGPDGRLMFNQCNVLPSDLQTIGMRPRSQFAYREETLGRARRLYPGEPARQAMFIDQHTFLSSLLDRNDRMTMGASIECRVPFLDTQLVEGLAALPSSALLSGFQGKPLLRRAIGRRLPRSVRRHRKWGFGVPWNRYLRTVPELCDLARSLHDVPPIADGPFDKRAVRGVVDAFMRGDDGYGELTMALVAVAIWHQQCCRSQSGSFAPVACDIAV